jgi:hypothetical protein
MRRLLLATAGLLALSCAGKSKPPEVTPPASAAAPAPVVPGMERQPDEVVTEYDTNRDGKPDVWKYTRKDAQGKEVLVRKEKDLNGDGRIDTWEAYAADGTLTRLVYDLDFDGKPDVTLIFEKDQLVRKEYALGFDGASRSWNFYEKGKLVRKERDTNGDGKVDYWEYWENGEIDRIGVDLDGDGQVDRWESRHAGETDPTASTTAASPPQK